VIVGRSRPDQIVVDLVGVLRAELQAEQYHGVCW
jgi:hypothetical protein